MKKVTLISVTFALILILITGVRPALAVDDLGLFELDGDALENLAVDGDDWETLYTGGGSADPFTGIMADSDDSSSDPAFQDDIFVGGRKDIQDVTDWGWKYSSGFPDKDEITNAYAAAYIQDGNLIVYFGADRYANNGDAFLGFWFFQNKISANPEDGSFIGQHEVGDILVLVNYPQSVKSEPEINIVQWNPAGVDNIAKNLELLYEGAECNDTGLFACAITNSADTDSPWPYIPKSGTSGTFPYESFFEGGINLTEILGTTPCFSSFMAETRSSKRFTATLKDFVLGDFEVCEISVEKECDVIRLTDEGDETDKWFVVDFNGIVKNTGAGSLPAGSTITVQDYTADSNVIVILPPLIDDLLPDESVPFSGQYFTNQNPPNNKVRAWLTFPDLVTRLYSELFEVDCVKLPLSPGLDVEKQCEVGLETIDNQLVVVVYFTGSVENTGNVPLEVTVEDNKAGIVFGPNMMDPNDFEVFTGFYEPNEADLGEVLPCNAKFSDTFITIGTSPLPDVNDQNDVTSVECPLCPEDCPE